MNIRFAPGSVRLRVSVEEAHALKCEKSLVQQVSLAQGGFAIELLLLETQSIPVKFVFGGGKAQAVICEKDFEELLEEKPVRESNLRAFLPSTSGDLIEFIFEIDLFSRKGGTHNKQ